MRCPLNGSLINIYGRNPYHLLLLSFTIIRQYDRIRMKKTKQKHGIQDKTRFIFSKIKDATFKHIYLYIYIYINYFVLSNIHCRFF